MISTLRAAFVAIVAITRTGFLTTQLAIARIFTATNNHKVLGKRYRQKWSRMLLKTLDVDLTLVGKPHTTAALYMANHRSYLDPAIIMAHVPATMLSKAEVAKYPIIGAGASAVGILFVQRNSMRSRGQSLQVILDAIKQGESVVVFPEGTTSGSAEPLPFKPALFSMAVENNIPVVPIALEYSRGSDAWLTETLWPHFKQKQSSTPIRAALFLGTPLKDATGNALMQRTRAELHKMVLQLRQQLDYKP